MNRKLPSSPSLARLGVCLLTGVVWCLPLAAQEPEPPPVSALDALKKGHPKVELRYRFETVDDDALREQAYASTLRTVLGYTSASYRGWSLFGEAENVTAVGNDLYDNRGAGSLANGVVDRPVVADPELTEINQAGVRYTDDHWNVSAGRQEILLGDVRFVGNVGWRQNHQSFDALRIENESLERVGFSYAYVDRVHRIFGDSLDLSAHLVNARIAAGGAGRLTLYTYLLDYREPAAAGLSAATWGAELSGQRELRDRLSLLWELEYAIQSDYADNPGEVDAGYSLVMAGLAWPRITARLGWEVLEGSAADGRFATPLATLHKFNGWADKFLVTPVEGLEDLYLHLGGTLRGFEWSARYHDFGAESTDASYGSEVDLQLLCKPVQGLSIGVKAALYDADGFSTDTEKLWLWATWSL